MAINDGIGNPVRDPFPGIQVPSTTGAPGGPGASGTGADSVPAGPVTLPTGAWQSAARYDAPTSGTMQAGQTDTNILDNGPGRDYVSTGAGSGSGAHYPRRPGQQPNGRS